MGEGLYLIHEEGKGSKDTGGRHKLCVTNGREELQCDRVGGLGVTQVAWGLHVTQVWRRGSVYPTGWGGAQSDKATVWHRYGGSE